MTTTFSREEVTFTPQLAINAGVIAFGFIGEVHVRAIRAAGGLVTAIPAKTIEEAKEILETDLAIKNGLLNYDIFTWYGSSALSEYLPFSDKIWKSKP